MIYVLILKKFRNSNRSSNSDKNGDNIDWKERQRQKEAEREKNVLKNMKNRLPYKIRLSLPAGV